MHISAFNSYRKVGRISVVHKNLLTRKTAIANGSHARWCARSRSYMWPWTTT